MTIAIIVILVLVVLVGVGVMSNRQSASIHGLPQPVYDYTSTPDEQLPENAYGLWDYLARDGVTRFRFNLVPNGSIVRIYIVRGPKYGNKNSDDHSTHRLTDEHGRKYICIKHDLAPTNTRDAAGWLKYWAENTVRYIRTGASFS